MVLIDCPKCGRKISTSASKCPFCGDASLMPSKNPAAQIQEKQPSKEPLPKTAKDPYRLTGIILNGKYRLVAYAGSGGMGVVYRAIRMEDEVVFAVKALKPDVVAISPEYADLFERETTNALHLDHPHIVKIFDSGKDDDLSYMVMEWIEGNTLEDEITQGQLSLDRITNIFEQVCSAVASAHDKGITHLDLKPGNILLLDNEEQGDFVKVIDFGLSRVIRKESQSTVTKFRGTPHYCAPEQFGGRVSYKSDIYSLGATLYYLIAGVLPFGASYINAKMHPNLDLPDIPPVTRQRDVPSGVDQVIKKALNKNPDLRQQSAIELFEQFKTAMFTDTNTLEDSTRVEKDTVRQQTDKSKNSLRLYAALIGLPVLLGIIGLIIYFTQSPNSTRDANTTVASSVTNANSLFKKPVIEATYQNTKTLNGHSGVVASVAFSPDGKTIASGSFDHTVKLWDAVSGELKQTFTGHSDMVRAVAFLPNGIVSASSDATIKMWDVLSGKLKQTLTGHRGEVGSLAISPDGKTIVSASDDATIKLWDAVSGQLKQTLTGHDSRVIGVKISPDGKTIASASNDETIKLWDAASGELKHTLTGHHWPVVSAVFSPDGKTIASIGGSGPIMLWDAATGELIDKLLGYSGDADSVQFSPDGKTIASGGFDTNIRLWDLASGRITQVIAGHSERVWSVAFSPDGKTIASGSGDNTIKLWRVE